MTKRRKASNWVDRGEPPEGKILRVLSYQCGRDPADPELLQWASVVRGMVEADASEVQLASYLQTLQGADGWPASTRRLLAVALWHIGKSGLLRDAASRRIAELLAHAAPTESLGEFLVRAVGNAPTREQYQPPPGAPRPRRPVR